VPHSNAEQRSAALIGAFGLEGASFTEEQAIEAALTI